MDVYIPIQFACQVMHDTGDYDHCPVLCELPNTGEREQDFLYLDTSIDGVDFGTRVDSNHALVLARPAFHHAKRLYDGDTITDVEDYVSRGEMIAKSLYFGSAHEYLAAWMNEDRKQGELIQILDMVLSLQILQKLPHWMRHDLLLALESESMKQVFAKRFVDHADKAAANIPDSIRKPLNHNADHQTHAVLSELLTGLFQKPLVYNGAGKGFVQNVQNRLEAFNSI